MRSHSHLAPDLLQGKFDPRADFPQVSFRLRELRKVPEMAIEPTANEKMSISRCQRTYRRTSRFRGKACGSIENT
jgi:hypothetical protein